MKIYNPKHIIPLYHISCENHDDEIFCPRIPDGAESWEEDYVTPRICVSTSIVGCVKAVDPCMWCPNVNWYVHVPYNLEELYLNGSIVMPSKDDVGDVQITREKWITEPCKMKCIGIIKGMHGMRRNIYRFRWIERYERFI